MELSETVEMMNSKDFKERFKAEYYQLEIRIQGLRRMIVGLRKGELNFVPKCSYDLLKAQLQLMSMEMYLEFLKDRAMWEEIEL